MNLRQLFLSFDGRINRAQFWLVTLVALLALAPAGYASYVDPMAFTDATVVPVLGGIAAVAGIYLLLSGGVKRLHDRNKSGAWLLLFGPGAAAIQWVGDLIAYDLVMLAFSVASFAISVWYFVETGFLRGTRGANEYGPDPATHPA